MGSEMCIRDRLSVLFSSALGPPVAVAGAQLRVGLSLHQRLALILRGSTGTGFALLAATSTTARVPVLLSRANARTVTRLGIFSTSAALSLNLRAGVEAVPTAPWDVVSDVVDNLEDALADVILPLLRLPGTLLEE